MKKCFRCGAEKSNDDFYDDSRGNGLGSYCKSCTKAYAKARGKANKEKAISLLGGKCSRCGYSRCFSALEFHHIMPENKERDVHDFRFYRWEKFWKEAKKCILLCANCHREVEEKV